MNKQRLAPVFCSFYVHYKGQQFSKDAPHRFAAVAVSALWCFVLSAVYVYVHDRVGVLGVKELDIFLSSFFPLFLIWFLSVSFCCIFYCKNDRWVKYVDRFDSLNHEAKLYWYVFTIFLTLGCFLTLMLQA